MCAFGVPVAHAGHWEIVPLARYPFGHFPPTAQEAASPQYKSWLAQARKRYTGKTTFSESEPPNGQSYPASPQAVTRQHDDKAPIPWSYVGPDSSDTKNGTMYWFASPFRSSGAFSIGGAASVEFKGDTNAILCYYPDDADDKPTAPVFLKVEIIANAGASDVAYAYTQLTRNPSKEHARITITPKGEISADAVVLGDADAFDTGSSKNVSTTTQFYVKFSPQGNTQKDAQGNITAVVPLVTINTKAWLSAGRYSVVNPGTTNRSFQWNPGSVGIFSRGAATVTNFSLNISRAGARALTSRNDPNFNADRDEYIDADGNGHGHTIYSYYEEAHTNGGGTDVPHPNVQYFSAGVAAPYGSTVGPWQWTPSENNDSEFSHSQEMPFGSLKQTDWRVGRVKWKGTPAGTQQKIVSYSNTKDGVEMKARYELTVHEPWEIVTTNTAAPARLNYRPHPYGSWVGASHDGDTVTGQLDQSYGWDVGVTFTGPGELIAGIIGIDVSASRNASTSVSVGNEHNDVRAGYECRVMVWDAVIRHSGTANEWNASGYVGTGPQYWEINEPDTPAGGMELGTLEWRGSGPEPSEGPFVNNPPGS